MYNSCCGLGAIAPPTDAQIDAAVTTWAARNNWTVAGWERDDANAQVVVALTTGERWALGWYNLGIVPALPDLPYTGQFAPTQGAEIVVAGVAALWAAVDSSGALPYGEGGEQWAYRWVRANVRDLGENAEAIFIGPILQQFSIEWDAKLAAIPPEQQPSRIEVDLIVEPNPNGVPDLWNVLHHRGHFFFADGGEKYSAWGQPGIFYNLTTAEVTPGAPWSRSTWPGTVGDVWRYDQVPASELERAPNYPFPGERAIIIPTAPPAPSEPSVPPATVTLPTGERVPIDQAPPGTFGPGIVPITPPPEVLYPATTPTLPPSSAIPATAVPTLGPMYAIPGAGYPTPEMPAEPTAPAVQQAGLGTGLLVGGGILAAVLLLSTKRRRRGPTIKGYRRY